MALRYGINNKFVRNNLIVFFGSLAISALNYLYYPILARLMSFNDFGEVQTLFSVFTQASLIFSAINIVTVVLISSRQADRRNEYNEKFIIELQKLMIYVVAAIGLAAIIISPWLRDFFHFQSVWPFMAMVLALIGSVPILFWNSYMQGQEDFTGMNLLGISGATGRLFLSAGLVVAGLGSFGAILGLFIGQIVAMLIVTRRRSLPSMKQVFASHLPDWSILKMELRFTGLVFFVSLMITVLYSGDILIIKHYHSAEVAGAYAGIASIARVIFFLTLPFAMVLLPAVNIDRDKSIATLKKSFILLTSLGLVVTLVFWAFSPFVVRTMIGARYEAEAYLLPWLSLAIFLISIANLLIYYLLSIRNILSLSASFIGLVTFAVTSFFYHQSPKNIVDNMLVASLVTVLILGVTMSLWPRVKGSRSFGFLRSST